MTDGRTVCVSDEMKGELSDQLIIDERTLIPHRNQSVTAILTQRLQISRILAYADRYQCLLWRLLSSSTFQRCVPVDGVKFFYWPYKKRDRGGV